MGLGTTLAREATFNGVEKDTSVLVAICLLPNEPSPISLSVDSGKQYEGFGNLYLSEETALTLAQTLIQAVVEVRRAKSRTGPAGGSAR